MSLRFHYGNLTKHNGSEEEVEECFRDEGQILRATGGGSYWIIAKTDAGRYLEIGFVREADDSAFVFHAMDAKIHQKRRYRRRGK